MVYIMSDTEAVWSFSQQLCHSLTVSRKLALLRESYYNLDLSFCLSVYQLLRQFWTDRAETRQEGRGRSRIEPKGIGCHVNQSVTMVFNKKCPVALILEWWCWNWRYTIFLAIWICMQKMNIIQQAVYEDYFMGLCTASTKIMLPPLNWSPR